MDLFFWTMMFSLGSYWIFKEIDRKVNDGR